MKIYKISYFIDNALAYYIDNDNEITKCDDAHITSVINDFELESDIKDQFFKEQEEELDWNNDWDWIATWVHDFCDEKKIFFVVVDVSKKQVYVRRGTYGPPSYSQIKALSDWAIENGYNEEVLVDDAVA